MRRSVGSPMVAASVSHHLCWAASMVYSADLPAAVSSSNFGPLVVRVVPVEAQAIGDQEVGDPLHALAR